MTDLHKDKKLEKLLGKNVTVELKDGQTLTGLLQHDFFDERYMIKNEKGNFVFRKYFLKSVIAL